MNKKIIFSTGGTGGHILPAINLMNHFFDIGYEVVLVTDQRGTKFLNDNEKFKIYELKTDTPTNKVFLRKILSFFVIFYSIIKSLFIIKREKPDIIFGFGGFVSFPISFASKFFNLPLVLYENNVVLGRANKYLSSFSKKIFSAKKLIKNFPKNTENKIYEVGSILNKRIIDYLPVQNNEKENFSILVLGGSQGAEIFGSIIPPVIKMIKNEGYKVEINQQCILNQKNSIVEYYKNNNIKNYVFEFEKNILNLIAKSNLAITRSGASTTAELVHTLTPFIAVPLPKLIDKHQYLNAKYYENIGCCWLLEQNSFNDKNLFNLIIEIIKNDKKLESIKKNMKKNYNKNVYKDIENEIMELLKNEN